MDVRRFLTLSGWKMTPKLLMAFLLTAVLPALATSLFSLNYFYGVSYENAQRNLTKELETARHFVTGWKQGLDADTRLAARENLVAINLSLGLTGPVLDYLDTLKNSRGLAAAELLDATGQPVERLEPNRGESGSSPLVTQAQLNEALEEGGTTAFASSGDGRILLLSLIPITDDTGSPSYFVVTALDPASDRPGGLLDGIRETVSGPVVIGSGRRVLGAAPGTPPWDANAPWPFATPPAGTFLPVTSQGATFVFGFAALDEQAPSPSVWMGVSFSLESFQKITDSAAGGLIVIALIFVLLSFVTAVAFSRGLTRPLLMMARQASAWTEGQGGKRLEVTTQDEAGTLGRAFNEVLDRLDGTMDSLRKTQNYLKNIFNSLTSILVSVDDAGTVTEWNVAAERFSGIKAAQALGKPVSELSTVFQGLEPSLYLAFVTREPQFLRKDTGRGRDQKSYDLCLYPLVWNGVSGVVIRMDDITDSLRKDRQLQQAQKMETVGTLTEGIAHNFNNLLTGITGTVSLIELDLRQPTIDRELLAVQIAMIESATHKAAEIVRRLMGLTKAGSGEFGLVDLVSMVKEVAKTSRMVLDNTVEIEVSCPNSAWVNGDRSQLEQCLLNLVINASHAMTIMRPRGEPTGGTIRVVLSVITTVKDFLVAHPEALQSDYWLLQVQDTGVGIPAENLSKVFDPFFTTKEQDKGSGLGLAMVYNSIRQHNGFVDVYSELGRGTTVSLYLPMVRDTSEVAHLPAHRDTPPVHRGEGLILVVDDEIVVQTTAQMILEACGYEVVTANNGLEALAVYQDQGRKIRGVVLDSSMPKLSGSETLAGLRKMNPEVRVIMSSGLFDGTRIEEFSLGPNVRFLAKPYSLADLSRTLFELLGGAS